MGLWFEGSDGNKKERVPAGAHSQNLSLSSPTRSYENVVGPDIGERAGECNSKAGLRGAPALLLAFGLFAAPHPASAESAAPFAELAGAWSGEGSAHFTDGSTSPLHCKATYTVSGGGDHLDQALDCMGRIKGFSFRIQLDDANGAILGAWQELTHRVQGGVVGTSGGGKFELAARGQGFSAQASIVARGGRQTIAIRGGGGDFASVSITLRRGG
jgi:hypothetical protein